MAKSKFVLSVLLVGSVGMEGEGVAADYRKWVDVMSTEHLPVATSQYRNLRSRHVNNMTSTKGLSSAVLVFDVPGELSLDTLEQAFLPKSKIQGKREVLKGSLMVKDFRIMEHRPERVTRNTKVQIQV